MKQELYITKALEWFDLWLNDFMDVSNYHGCSISFMKDEDVIFSKSYGKFRDEELKQDSLFRMASHSKNMTAIAIMKLAEEEKLNLDDKVSKHVDFLNLEDKGYQNITIRQVLNHSAGIKRDGLDASFWGLKRDFPDKEELKNFFRTSKTYVENNTRLKYSNFGYGLLGLIIEKVTGQEYNSYVQDNLFKDLTDIAMEANMLDESRIALGYIGKALTGRYEEVNTKADTKALSSATGLTASTKAMTKFYKKLYFGDESIISDEAKKELFRPNFDMNPKGNVKYGLGFRSKKYDGFLQIGHTGGFPGCISATALDPKEKMIISCATNDTYGIPLDIVYTLIDFINFFEKHKEDLAEIEAYDFKTVMLFMWGSCLFIPVKDKIYVCSSDYSRPLKDFDELEKVNNDFEYKIVKCSNAGSYGEEVSFEFKDDKLACVNYAGYQMEAK